MVRSQKERLPRRAAVRHELFDFLLGRYTCGSQEMLFSPTRMSVARQMLRLSVPFVTVVESVTPSYSGIFEIHTEQIPSSMIVLTTIYPVLSGAQLAYHSQP